MIPIAVDDRSWGSGKEFDICPGKGYPIVKIAQYLFPDAPNFDTELGRWRVAYAARTTDEQIIRNASSGGVMTGIAAYLLESGIVDGVVTTKLKYGENGPRPKTTIVTKKQDLFQTQGSKYCPVTVFDTEPDIATFNGKLAFIGTPCQIAALRMLQQQDPSIGEKVILTIGNFCGGYRDLRETDKIIERAGFRKTKVSFFRYRGGGQPGSMLIKDRDCREVQLPYPQYSRMTGIVKYLRCRICVDATGELADISCGDAWIPRFLETKKGWSIVMARSELAEKILTKMQQTGDLCISDVSVQEIKASQYDNLNSKKKRQTARMKMFQLLGKKLPSFDGSYYPRTSNLLFELKVHLSHSVFATLEKIGLYKPFAKLIGRYPQEKDRA
jgi:coenzyme F420 hydrogenase subunit beta